MHGIIYLKNTSKHNKCANVLQKCKILTVLIDKMSA